MPSPWVNQFSNMPGGGINAAMSANNALAHNMLKTKYYGPDIQSQIENRNALTEKTKTMTPLEAAELQLKNQFYAPNIQSEINNRNALTDKYNKMTPLEARELDLKNNMYNRVTESNMRANEALANFRNSGGGGGGVGQKELKGFEHQLSTEHPEWNQQQVNQAASAYLSGATTLPDGTPLPPVSGYSQTFLDQIVKRGNTAQGLNQQRFANTTDRLLNEGAKLMPSVSKYAGSLGKAKGNIDAVASSLGANSPEYNDYLKFTRVIVPTAAGEMMRALGVNASDTQKQIYLEVMNPLTWDSNPKVAMENYNYMQKLFKETVGKTVGQSIGETRNELRKKSNTAPQLNKLDTSKYDVPAGSILMWMGKEPHFFPADQAEARLLEGYTYE